MVNEKVFPWWKRYGETIRETRERFLLFHPELRELPVRYEGRLDPLAEGVILFVLPHGEEGTLRSLEKKYEVDVLLGIRTDSGDILGVVEEVLPLSLKNEDVPLVQREVYENLEGCHLLPIPLYSSPHIKELREKGYKEGEFSKREMCFRELQSETLPSIGSGELFEFIRRWVSSVPGDFRQQKILSRWGRIIPLITNELPLVQFSFRANSGAYVRSFIAEFTRQTRIPATSLRIRRVMMGKWGREDCPFL